MDSTHTHALDIYRLNGNQDPTGSGNAAHRLPHKRSFLEFRDTAYHYDEPQINDYTDKRYKQDSTERSTELTVSWCISNTTSDPYLPPIPRGNPSWDFLPHSRDESAGSFTQELNNYVEIQSCSPEILLSSQTTYSESNQLSPALGYEGHVKEIGVCNAEYTGVWDSDGDVAMHGSDVDDSEICFGMIQDAIVTSTRESMHKLIAPDTKPGKRKKQKASEIIPVTIQPRKPLTTVHLQSGEYIGLLDRKTLKGINQLLALCSIRLEPFITPAQNPPEQDPTGGTLKSRCRQLSLYININIYGPRHMIDSVGKVLSINEIYLQHPKHNDAHLDYQNPHYFTGPEDTNIISVAKTRKVENIEEEIKTLFELSVNESLPEAEPGNGLQTQLLSHQKQAVHFMLQKETNDFCRDDSLATVWKVGKTENGCTKYINSITKETTSQRPQNVYGGILADEMGLGKSLTTLALITSTMEQARHFEASPVDNSIFRCAKPRIKSKTTLIIAPASLLDSWREQISIHIKSGLLKVYIYHGPQKETDPEKLIEFDIIITTYPTIRAELFPKGVYRSKDSPMNAIKWFRVVLDEAHIIREKSTQQSRAVCLLEAQRRWCLSGTPIQNKLHDFGTLLRFLRVSPFDEEALFNRYIIKPLKMADPDGLRKLRMLIGSTCLRRNKKILELPPRTDQTQYIHLKPADRHLYEACKKDSARLIEQAISGNKQGSSYFSILQSILRLRLFCNHGKELLPTEVQNRLEWYPSTEPLTSANSDVDSCTTIPYETFLSECSMCNMFIDPAETDAGSFTTCSHTVCGRCAGSYGPNSVQPELATAELSCPICTTVEGCTPNTTEQANFKWMEGVGYSGPSAKVKALLENLRRFKSESINEPPKSIVFSCWTKILDLIGLALNSEGIGYARFDGSISIQQRRESIDRFREDPQVNVLLISIGSGGVGLNLTIASRVHLMEPQWNPMVEQQALDRLHRIGQKKEVIATRYIVKNSIEESILAFQQRKLALANLSLSQNQPAGKGNEHLKELQALFR